jgi:hypothetical protein
MRRLCITAASIASIGFCSPALADERDWQRASDVGAYGLMAFSIGLPVMKKDKHGVFQASGSLLATSVVTEAMKEAFPKTRPDRSDRKSFPSGHTSRSLSSAATIYNRYGAKNGIPAFAVASLVGAARYEGRKQNWSDVPTGAALSTASGLLIKHKRPTETKSALMPRGDTKSAGISFAMASK